MADVETGLNNRKEHVIFPSDMEEAMATLAGKSYTRMRSGPVKVYTKRELEQYSKDHPELPYPYDVWKKERAWRWIIGASGTRPKGKR